MLQLGLKPQIQIIDGLEKRNHRIVPVDDTINTNLSCRNPPGEITEESIQVIQKAFSCESVSYTHLTLPTNREV